MAAITQLMPSALPLHPEVQDLLDALRALEDCLRDHDDCWASQVGKAANEIAGSDAHGLRRFLGLFGGMGSLNDLVLQRNGTPLGRENDRLATLRTRAWTLADGLRTEIKSNGAL